MSENSPVYTPIDIYSSSKKGDANPVIDLYDCHVMVEDGGQLHVHDHHLTHSIANLAL